MSEISSRIDNLLADMKLKRIDLARATGIGESTIRAWIKGSTPSAEAAVKVAKYFGVSVEWLVTGKEENKNVSISNVYINYKPEDMLEFLEWQRNVLDYITK